MAQSRLLHGDRLATANKFRQKCPMGLDIKFPPHPSGASWEDFDAVVPSQTLPTPRDPHQLPTFACKSSVAPVLYLPPLLSSLPASLSPLPTHGDHPPLTTTTRLSDIDPASLHLHKALHYFGPVTPDYASVSYLEAFNWSELALPDDTEREWYCVVFRSKRKPGSDGELLYEADNMAHEEAVRNGGLIMYWYGIPHPETGINLATCIWQSRRHAIAANSRPHHIKAMKLASSSYEMYVLERYTLRKAVGEVGVRLEPYLSGEVGW